MIIKDSAGRLVEMYISGSDIDDIQVEGANYLDSDEEVSDSELDYIFNKYASQIEDEWIQIQVMKSESYYEGDR